MVSEPVDALDGAGGIERQLLNSTREGIYGVNLDGTTVRNNPRSGPPSGVHHRAPKQVEPQLVAREV